MKNRRFRHFSGITHCKQFSHKELVQLEQNERKSTTTYLTKALTTLVLSSEDMAPENTLMLCSWEKQNWKSARQGGGWVWEATPVKWPSHSDWNQWGKPNTPLLHKPTKEKKARWKLEQVSGGKNCCYCIHSCGKSHLPLCSSFMPEKNVKSQSTPRSNCWCPISAGACPCFVGSHCWYQHGAIIMNLLSISSSGTKTYPQN